MLSKLWKSVVPLCTSGRSRGGAALRRSGRARIAAAAILALAVAAPGAALAGGRVGIQGGAAFFPGSVDLEHDGKAVEGSVDDGAQFGIEGGWTATDALEIGGTVQLGNAIFDSSATSVTAGPRYAFRDKDAVVRPFAVGQLGYYVVGVDTSVPTGGLFDFLGPDETDDGFGFNVGGGVDVYPLRWLSVGADVRYHRAFVFGGVNYFTTMLGAAVHFGGDSAS